MPLIAHLIELRSRLIRAVAAVVVVFLALYPFKNELYTWLARPLLAKMPKGASLIATEVAAPFVVPFKFTLVVACFLAMPFILYQAWRFIAPGLYTRERRLALPIVALSALLFYGGAAFAYYVVFSLAFGFFVSSAPEGITVMTDMSRYLDFVLTLLFSFGVAFQVPIVAVVLVWTGVTTPQAMVAKRSYVIVGAFVAGAILTPPDVLSQTLLAIPMWLLFEAGVLMSRFYVPQPARDEADLADD
jgi:sec-independent protein translocase protein TatC